MMRLRWGYLFSLMAIDHGGRPFGYSNFVPLRYLLRDVLIPRLL